MRALALALACMTGCYAGPRAAEDVNAAWRGRTRRGIEGRWGKPASTMAAGPMTQLVWTHSRKHYELPSAEAHLSLEPGRFDAMAALRPGSVWTSKTDVMALVDPGGTITRVEGPSLRWGPPNNANIRWGTILGLHVGMGTLDDTSTPLPSGGVYIGGMLGRTLGLVGCYSMVAGTSDDGGAMGFAWGMALQWWPMTRVWLRTGPALVLDFDPGFVDATLSVGFTSGASFALAKAGTFVLDLRLDVTASVSAVFGSIGIGVNMN